MDYKAEFQSDDDFDCSNSYSDKFQQQSSNNAAQNQFNTSQGRLTNSSGLSKAELRKTNKPIMEKRRRARINQCLNELKSLILEAMKKDPARHTKLEKADILEMTVKHLQSIQRQQLNIALQTDPTVIHKFKTGFMECADEVNRYVSQLDGVEEGVRRSLNSHLNNCASSLEQIGSMTNFSNGYRTGASTNFIANAKNIPLTVSNNGSLFPALPQDFNNNPATAIQMGGVQLIPSRLPSGEFALIVPNTGSNAPTATAVINTNSNPPFPTWPCNNSSVPANNTPPINDFAANFKKRLSAFSKPQTALINPLKVPAVNNYPQTALSHTKYTQQTQPQHQSAFHTTTTTSPPLSPISSSSNNEDSITTNSCTHFTTSRSTSPRQQKQNTFSGVLATPPSSAENSFVSSVGNLQQQQVSSTSSSDLNSSSNSSLKRSFSETIDSSVCSEDEKSIKKCRKNQQEVEDQESMWRPW